MKTIKKVIFATEIKKDTGEEVQILFTVIPKIENYDKKLSRGQDSVISNKFEDWIGEDRKQHIREAKMRGNEVEFRSGSMEVVGIGKAKHGFTQPI